MHEDRYGNLQKIFSIIVGIICVVALWTFVLWLKLVSQLLLPWPSKVIVTLYNMVGTMQFWQDLSSTVITWLAGVIIGTIVGTFFGILLALNRYVWAAVEPWVEFVRALPSVVLIPLVSLFMGVGIASRLLATSLVVIVLMMSTSGSAIRSTSLAHMRLATAWRVTPIQRLFHFQFPSALSHMAVALKAAIPLALIVAVAADMLIATDSGIGKIIMDSLAVFDTAKLYAAVLVVGALGYFAALIGSTLERLTIHWSGR